MWLDAETCSRRRSLEGNLVVGLVFCAFSTTPTHTGQGPSLTGTVAEVNSRASSHVGTLASLQTVH